MTPEYLPVPRIERIFIDIDGVLANYLERLLDNYNQRHGTSFIAADVTDWHLKNILQPGQKWGDYIDKDFWTALKSYPWAHSLVRLVRDTKLPYAFLTALLDENRPDNAFATFIDGRRKWLDDQFPTLEGQGFPPSTRLIFASCKDLVVKEGDLLIEDASHNVNAARAVGAHVLALAQPWNQDIKCLRCTPEQILRFLGHLSA